MRRVIAALSIPFLLLLMSCQTTPSPASVLNTVPPSLRIPTTVERLAVFYPKTENREFIDAYSRLAGAAFQFKEQRPALQIVDRVNLTIILREQSLELSGAVSDETAMHLGRLLGADSILLYQIDGPTFQDRVRAEFFYGEPPPFTVISKIIRVESGEVVYHNVVTAPVMQSHQSFLSLDREAPHDLTFLTALDRGVAQTIGDLQHAFR